MDTVHQLAMQQMLSAVESYQASALHLSVGHPPLMRVNDQLVPVADLAVLTSSVLTQFVESWLTEAELQRLADTREVTIGHTFENGRRFRISLFYQQGSVSATLVLMPTQIPTLQDMGHPEAVQQLVQVPSGLVLIIGPYGSLQSLTIMSMIEQLNQTTAQHIVTIEQPVEYVFSDAQSVIDQREVGVDVPSVEEGVSFLLHEDVDVVFVSDLPNEASLLNVLALASAGKTVFAQMTVATCVEAINTLIYAAPEENRGHIRSLLASVLAGIVNQRRIVSMQGDAQVIDEVLIPSDSVRTIIQQGDVLQLNNVLLSSQEPGVVSLDHALRQAVERGVLSIEHARTLARQPELFGEIA